MSIGGSRWLFHALAAIGLCGLSGETWGQNIRPMWASPDAPAASPAGLADGRSVVRLPADPAYSHVGESDLAAQVADLTVEVERLKAAEAKAVTYPTVVVGGRLMVD